MISDGRIGRFNEKGTGLDIRSVLKTPFYTFLRALHSRNAADIRNSAFSFGNRFLLMSGESKSDNLYNTTHFFVLSHFRNATNIRNLAFFSENRYLLMFSVSQGHNHSCKHDGYAFYSLVLHVVTYI